MLDRLEPRRLLSLSAPVSYTIGSANSTALNNISADGVATGDFNRDGKLDLAVVHTADNTVNILLNNGNGTFHSGARYSTGATNSVWVSVADVNGDGKLDLVTLGSNSTSTGGIVSVFIGNGDGTFQSAVTYATGSGSRGGVAIGDFNGDGKPDLAVAAQYTPFNANQSAINILINNGNGTFQSAYVVPTFGSARGVTAGDFNGDGKTDLAVADGVGINNTLDPTYPAGMTILFGNGNGTFTNAGQYNALPTPDAGNNGSGGGDTVNPELITAADLNHDGKLDLILSLYDHNIDVYLNNGNGTFQPAVGYDTGEYPRAVGVADVTGDGNVDLIVNNVGANNGDKGQTEPGSIAVLAGNGNGTFQSATQYTPFNFPGWLAMGDFNGDGFPDVAVTRVSDGHSVNIMFDSITSPASPITVFGNTAPPASQQNTYASDIPPHGGAEAGLKFRSDVAGIVTAIRFYKGNLDTGTHTGELWSNTGQLLATATFTNETSSGWQQVNLSDPVTISANTTYIVSYHTTAAYVAYTPYGLANSGVNNSPLHILANGVDGNDGVYAYGTASAFPNLYNSQAPNYWVDIAFTPTSSVPDNILGNSVPDPNFQNVNASTIPANGGAEIGSKFRSDVAGVVTGVRFYKGSLDTGLHTGELWSSTGTLLATATFTNEGASGWQQVTFSNPVTIAANTTYIVSYHTTAAYIAYTPYALANAGINNGPLHLLANGADGGNGVYGNGPNSVFPTIFNGQSPNYWVDVLFNPS